MMETQRALVPEDLHPHGLRSKWITGRDILETLGWRKTLGEAAPWFLARRYVFYWYDLGNPVPGPPAAVPFQIERASAENLRDFLALRPGYYTRGLLEKRLARGHVGILVRSGGRPVLMRWVFLGRVFLPYFDRTLVLQEGDAYTDETFTARAFRRRGLFSASGHPIRLALRDMGLARVFSSIASWNAAPLKDAPRSGGMLFGECRIARRAGSRSASWIGEIRDRGDGTIAFLGRPDQPGFTATQATR